jgi:DHA2 family multidrug resistance protein
VALPFIAQGLAMPFFFIPTNQLALSSVLPDEVAAASGLSNFMRTTSAAFATSLVTTNWENAAVRDRVNMVGAINDPTGLINKLKGIGGSSAQALAQIDGVTQGQAVMLATDQMFLITSLAFVVAAAVMWLAPKPTAPAGPVMGGH